MRSTLIVPGLRQPTTVDEAFRTHLDAYFEGHRILELQWTEGPIRQRVPGFAVHEVSPGPRLEAWTYVTTGCWRATAQDGHGYEFVLTATRPHARHFELLTTVAFFHAGPDSRLALGVTVPMGQPWLGKSLCTHLLFARPYAYAAGFEVCTWASARIQTLAALPITQAERDYRHRLGLDALEQRLEEQRVLFADPLRPSAV